MTAPQAAPVARRNDYSRGGDRRKIIDLYVTPSMYADLGVRAKATGVSVSRLVAGAALGGVHNPPITPDAAEPFAQAIAKHVSYLTPIAAHLNDLARDANTNHVVPDDTVVTARNIEAACNSIRQTLQQFSDDDVEISITDAPGLPGQHKYGANVDGEEKRTAKVQVLVNEHERALLKARAHNRGSSVSRLLLDCVNGKGTGTLSRDQAFRASRQVWSLLQQVCGCRINLKQISTYAPQGSHEGTVLEAIAFTVYSLNLDLTAMWRRFR